ncbi:hypothetical protein HDV03_002100 [Kappamyces sp. JEL0829]|nr:hypothetical protein HDV03_002100 [Kappamyces sp. JEL0829]
MAAQIQASLAQGRGSEAFIYACEVGLPDQVSAMLSHPAVDPTADDYAGFKLACQKGHLDVVELLLKDSRIDPTAENNYSLKFAAQEGKAAVVSRLLLDKRIPQTAKDSAARLARKNGHQAVAELLDPEGKTVPDPKKINALGSAARTTSSQGWAKGGNVFDKFS